VTVSQGCTDLWCISVKIPLCLCLSGWCFCPHLKPMFVCVFSFMFCTQWMRCTDAVSSELGPRCCWGESRCESVMSWPSPHKSYHHQPVEHVFYLFLSLSGMILFCLDKIAGLDRYATMFKRKDRCPINSVRRVWLVGAEASLDQQKSTLVIMFQMLLENYVSFYRQHYIFIEANNI
jgi:hypothetical protein